MGPQLQAENQALRKELQQATAKSVKLQYQVEHLKDAVRAGDTHLVAALEASDGHRQSMINKFQPLLSVAHMANGKPDPRTDSSA